MKRIIVTLSSIVMALLFVFSGTASTTCFAANEVYDVGVAGSDDCGNQIAIAFYHTGNYSYMYITDGINGTYTDYSRSDYYVDNVGWGEKYSVDSAEFVFVKCSGKCYILTDDTVYEVGYVSAYEMKQIRANVNEA